LTPNNQFDKITIREGVNMAVGWNLAISRQSCKIGEFKGQSKDCYRILKTKEEEIKEIRCTYYNSETILVYYPIAVVVQNQSVYACEVIWKESGKTEFTDSKEILIGDIDETLLKTDRNYFNCLMRELLELKRIYKYIKTSKEDNNKLLYIGCIKKIGGIYRRYMNKNMMDECEKSKGIKSKREILEKTIKEYNNEIIK
jgi:hypothetical protein